MKKLAMAEMKIFRGAFLAFLIMSMCFVPSVQAASYALIMNGGSPIFDAVPATVSAVSNLLITDLEQHPDGESFGTGDCFEIDFQPISEYDVLKTHNEPYLVFPGNVGDSVDCTGLTPAGIKCELVTNFRIKMTMGATSATAINGPIAGMHNPFSTYQLKINSISWKSA